MLTRAGRLVPASFRPLARTVARYLRGRHRRHAMAIATHVPALVAIATLVRIERVLELGAGEFSTLTFLNRAAFPHLAALRSLENDDAWYARMAELTRDDPRVCLTHVSGALQRALGGIDLDDYDLIFIDEATLAARIATIREVARRCSPRSVVVIHDFETREYREAARTVPNHFAFTAFLPHTGVVWNGARLDRKSLGAMDRTLRTHRRLAPDDVAEWATLFAPDQNRMDRP